jgi:DMSO/TMAO reductase YedYZ molybdopterin-dependent catalytic subunit
VLAKTSFAKRISRRDFLWGAIAAGGLASNYLSGAGVLRRATATSSPRVPVASNETSPELLSPNVDFFVRNHFATPKINSEAWNLEISGMVSKPFKLSYSDLLLTSSVRRAFTTECAGNRSGGAGVGTALWSGLPLAKLLKQSEVRPGAATVVLHGADSGDGENVPAGTHFARAIPLEKAMDLSTLLAYEMNGQPLPADHGFPLRALVPGWYGMDSVKWLTRIEIADQPFKGYFQQEEYVALKTNGERRPITRMLVNSKFLRPSEGEEIRVKAYRIEGAAWAGEDKVSNVELRMDPSGPWQKATLSAPAMGLVWTPWSYDWHIPRPGQYTLEVRASDDVGNSQPGVRDPGRKDAYELNTPHRLSVNVRF